MPRRFADAYCDGDEYAQELLPPLTDAADRFQPIRDLAPEVWEELHKQQVRFGESAACRTALEKLRKPGARVVVTGQQAGLFLGPMYTFYKAFRTIEWAAKLEAATGAPVVPVFWLQTEDHDFAEVSTARFLDGTGGLISVQAGSGEPDRVSIAHRSFVRDSELALERLSHLIQDLPYGSEVVESFARYTYPGASWSDAFAQSLHRCFSDEGMLILNPRCGAVARRTREIHRVAIDRSEDIGELLDRRAHSLRKMDFKVQVKIRRECSLSFFHIRTPSGPRYRVKVLGSSFGLSGSDAPVTRESIYRALEDEPLRFSSSALLRPIVQDTVLPTVAYVAGPGELSYFAQIEPLYRLYGLTMPMIVPRLHATVIDPETSRVFKKFPGLRAEEMSQEDLDSFARQLLPHDPAAIESTLNDQIEHALTTAEQTLSGLELERAFSRTRATVQFAIRKLSERAIAAQLRKENTVQTRMNVLKNRLRPNGMPQERTLSIAYYLARFGLDGLKDAVRSAQDPGFGRFAMVKPVATARGGRL